METLDVGIQIIYPTLFLTELTQRSDVDIALCTSYNNWLAKRCESTGGKLRWVALLPLGSIADAVEEMRRVHALGASGVFKRGIEWNRNASDSYFYPIYAEAERLNLPICIHSSLPWTPTDPTFSRFRTPFTLGFTGMSVLAAFYAIVADHVPEQFPSLRFGFIEAGSSWLTHLSEILGVRDRRTFLESNNLYVTCETPEDLEYITKSFGHSNFMVGTDYSHGDRASVMNIHRTIMGKAEIIGEEAVNRMTSGTAREFYALHE
jgi:predicted TIM-barrel fold metal-dependent hydrolase